tara:strand:+ start:250 stop:810 length:561 start_codon:yes stop_codon:yes gene_type:complete
MKPVYTIHAGEYFVGSHIEKIFPNCNIWIPSKDTGIDLLISNANNTKTVSIQVKSSKDYSPSDLNPDIRNNLVGSSWFSSLNNKSLTKSKADFWVLVIFSFKKSNYQYVVIPKEKLLKLLKRIHPGKQNYNSFIWVTKEMECWETRGLKKTQLEAILNNETKGIDKDRNFSEFLNNWTLLEQKLKK